MKRKAVKRLVIAALCVFFVIAGVVFSAVFASVCFRHNHDHNGPGGRCVVCAQLTMSGDLLKLLSIALVGAAVGLGCFYAVPFAWRVFAFQAHFTGLVRLKTRLNN